MAGSVSKTILVGRLGSDPASHTFADGGKVVSFSLATSESWHDQAGTKQQKTEWHNIRIFSDALAEVAERFLKKGALVYLEGKNETRSYDKAGTKVYTTEVVLRQFGAALQMLDSAPQAEQPSGAPRQRGAQQEPGGRS